MPALSPDSPIEAAKRRHIQQVVQKAADEEWTLEKLAETLGVTTQTARTYISNAGGEIRRLIRLPREKTAA